MGAVFRPRGFGKENRKIIENAIKDFSPYAKDNVIKLLNSWEGGRSAGRLREIIGQNKSEEILRIISDDINFSEDERTRLRTMFRESLTFD